MENDDLKNSIKAILLKKAEGYFYNEEINEYQLEENNEQTVSQQLEFDLNELNCNQPKKKSKQKSKNKLVLIKKKITSHHMPPDLNAVKMLLELSGQSKSDLSNLSDEELEKLKDQLIDELKKL